MFISLWRVSQGGENDKHVYKLKTLPLKYLNNILTPNYKLCITTSARIQSKTITRLDPSKGNNTT